MRRLVQERYGELIGLIADDCCMTEDVAVAALARRCTDKGTVEIGEHDARKVLTAVGIVMWSFNDIGEWMDGAYPAEGISFGEIVTQDWVPECMLEAAQMFRSA